ncbi:hypothetical protein [Devosia sp. SL43]|uniref:hypothetical protein n=1 Tax=Devosia sp. SL43 TaxID=2806348 RepID=UPI001F396A54|nr:hypothetical protein [Devosia sp. SL43]UJW86760.1 hypothetical protein IM737_05770 [Devosia sp. SL43]
MKKILALVLVSVMVMGVAAPSFAATAHSCVFKDASMCVSTPISSMNNDDN